MNDDNLITIIGNVSRSLFSVQKFITGLAYVIALLFFVNALIMLKKTAETPGHGRDKLFVPLVYMIIGSALLFLPNAVEVLSNTAFGSGNILSYTHYNPYNVQSSVELLIRTAGLIWFVRGCVLVAHASQPGVQHGPKGMAFLVGGICAMNVENTMAMINTALMKFIDFTLALKHMSGY